MSRPKQNTTIRYGSITGRNTGPIDISAISQTNTGIVRVRKGTVYMNLNKGTGDEATPYWLPIIVRDEFGNAVEMVRHSDSDDTMVNGIYINNQGDNNRPDRPPGGFTDRSGISPKR